MDGSRGFTTPWNRQNRDGGMIMSEQMHAIEQKNVLLYDDEVTAIRGSDGHIYVSVRHLCDALGVTQRSQVLRIQRNDILAEGYKGGIILITPGGRQPAGVLRVDLVPLWLTGISIKAVKDEIQPKLHQFQREAAKVLMEAFVDGRLTTEPSFDDLLKADSPAAQAYRMAQAMMQLARQQLLLESRIDDHETRLERLETQADSTQQTISEAQASQISQAVKAVALTLSKRSGRNEYGGVYGEMYRRFQITGYKLLPATRFQEAIDWLTEWHQALTGDTPF